MKLQVGKTYLDHGNVRWEIVAKYGQYFIGKLDLDIHRIYSEYGIPLTDEMQDSWYHSLQKEYIPAIVKSYDVVWTVNSHGGLGGHIVPVGMETPSCGKEVRRETVSCVYQPGGDDEAAKNR